VRMRDDEESWADLCRLPTWFAGYMQNHNVTDVTTDTEINTILKNLKDITVSSRAYFWGKRVISNYAESHPKELMSIMATPNFYNRRSFSGVLVAAKKAGLPEAAPSYYFGEVR
jgi:hypothetical protein